MSNATALGVLRVALQQYHYTESPPGSNRTKYGKWFGLNGEPWCAELVCWCGAHADGDNPIAKSANAAGIQDLTVKTKGGKYILQHTANNKKKKAALDEIRYGDNVSFNFSGGTSRQHTGFAVGVWGEYVYCIEGNTSFDNKGSQNNGGAVALRKRHYSTIVCVDRPAYTPKKFFEPSKAYTGGIPKLPARGWFQYGDQGERVAMLQNMLRWANGIKLSRDGDFKAYTFAEVVIFQLAHKQEPDGQWGPACQKVFKALVKKHEEPAKTLDIVGDVSDAITKAPADVETLKLTKSEKLIRRAKADAWPSGTKKKVYRYPKGEPRPEYKADLKKAYGSRKGWGKQTKAGASCDVFVGTVARASGVDKSFPRGLSEQIPYLEKSKKWKRVKRKNRQPGDIVLQKYKTGGKHIMILLPGKKVANAHYVKKTYPIIEKASKIIKPAKKCKIYRVYRAA